MNTYTLLVVLLVAAALIFRGWKAGSRFYVFVACLLLFAVYGLRNASVIGVDSTSSYMHLFEGMGNYSWSSILSTFKFNVGFYLLTKILYHWTGGDYQLYCIFLAAIAMICFGHFIRRYSPSPLQSVLYYLGLLLYTFHFSALKQSLAMSFVLLAFDHVIARRPIRFLLTVGLASAFHFPALVFLPAYWIAQKPPGKNYLIGLAALLLVTYLFRDQLLNLMLGLYGDAETVQETMSGIAFLRTKAIIMIIIVIVSVIIRKPTQEETIYGVLLKFMGLAIVFQTFCGYNNIFERLADYYFQFAVVFIPMVFDRKAENTSSVSSQTRNAVAFVGPVLFCSYGIYRFLTVTMANPQLYPHQFFFQ